MPASRRVRTRGGWPREAASLASTSRRAVAASCCGSSSPMASRTSSSPTPRWRSSAASARRARPRLEWRHSTHAVANATAPRRPGAARGPARRRCQAACGWPGRTTRASDVSGVRGIGVELGPDTKLLFDLLLDLVGEVRVAPQEVPRVLLALAELVALVGVPGARLADDRLLHTQIDQAALPADADTEQNIEFCGLARRTADCNDTIFRNKAL